MPITVNTPMTAVLLSKKAPAPLLWLVCTCPAGLVTTAVISITELPWLVRNVVVMRSEPVRLGVGGVVEVVVLLKTEVVCEVFVESVVEEVVDDVVKVTVAVTVTGTVTTDTGTLSVDGSSGGDRIEVTIPPNDDSPRPRSAML